MVMTATLLSVMTLPTTPPPSLSTPANMLRRRVKVRDNVCLVVAAVAMTSDLEADGRGQGAGAGRGLCVMV